MRNLLLEVRNIRQCEGGHTCNLIANGRKVAFVGPNIFEWSSNSQMVDVLEWFAAKHRIKLNDKPTKLREGWENEVPDYKVDRYEDTQAKLSKWVETRVLIHAIQQRCKKFVLCLDGANEFYQFDYTEKTMPSDLWDFIKVSKWKCLNKMTTDEIMASLSGRWKVPELPAA